MITRLKTTIWAMALIFSVASVMVLSSCGEDDPAPPPPDPVVAPGVSYAATTVAVGAEGSVTAAVTGDAATYEMTDNDDADFITVKNTGEISVAAESTTGVYTVTVKATNSAGSVDATAEITIGVNEAFDPTGKDLYWKYFMNNTEDVTLLNLDQLVDGLPAAIPLPTGWPAGWPDAINPADPTFAFYFIFTGVQELLMQVPGDDACKALDPAESGDNLLVIVNPDLTLSTICHVGDDLTTTVEIGTSEISFMEGKYSWDISTALEGTPISIVIGNARIETFVDPLHPHYSEPSGQGGAYSAVMGTVASYLTPTDFTDYLGSLALLNVDVVLEILE